ncbi:FtsX-like permease family protein [Sporosarcina sp. 6E9]|uniref:ABC transporter permease n=1 Tax=Sporosarcina sp. 6E9 TaxID=2819235 RepID=UPI0034CF6BFF
MTALTLFDLVIRSMRKNIKHYYLYFFALIFSVVLYFVFATLQYDSSIVDRAGQSMKFDSAFKVAGGLLIFIAGIFIVYANAIFLKRRSREIGLYQLIGLNKAAVSRLLIIENTILSAGALVIGIGVGILVSRVFLLLLMKLVGYEGFIALSFSTEAILQTIIVFVAIILLTTIQMIFAVYRNTLLSLFNADKKGENPKKPKTVVSAILALLGIGLIVFGYWLSGNMLNEWLLFNMVAVLVSTILGTYLLFRITISWLFYKFRARKQGHLGLNNSLSIASLMHRMKGNANSLTIITVLSAMTLAMLAGCYSLYYSTEKESRYSMPHDFMFESNGELAAQFGEELKENGIGFTSNKIELLTVWGTFEKKVFPEWDGPMDGTYGFSIVSDQQLEKAGFQVKAPTKGKAVMHDMMYAMSMKNMKLPFDVNITSGDTDRQFRVTELGSGNVVNYVSVGFQLVIGDAYFEELKEQLPSENEDSKILDVFAVNLLDKDQLKAASKIFFQSKYIDHAEGENYAYAKDYYSMYENGIQTNGLLIFIAGFLGLVFLISTGSILYFKQMTEAEQEKQSYATLRQLGFTVKDIMKGIIRKQMFVFGLPLAIGLLHSVFAIKAASFLFMSDITVPTTIAMGLYAIIYIVFAFLTIGYYRKTVKAAL